MLRNWIVVAALVLGLICIGLIISADAVQVTAADDSAISADAGGGHVSLGAPTVLASRALAGP